MRAHRALALINEDRERLVAIAADCAFADQSHLTREIVYLTGLTPGALRRRSNPFKTGSGGQR
jgi:AraC-like DNA-binding protein